MKITIDLKEMEHKYQRIIKKVEILTFEKFNNQANPCTDPGNQGDMQSTNIIKEEMTLQILHTMEK